MNPNPTLDSVTIDLTGLTPREAPPNVRAWTMPGPDGDGFGIWFFALPPDIPPSRDVAALRATYQEVARQGGSKLVETVCLRIDGRPAVKNIFKTPQRPTGMTYVATITVPFRDFSFVFKTQCEERGVTGVREAMLLNAHLKSGGAMEMRDGRMHAEGFDPDSERFDADFPTHPLSRARRTMAHVARTARFDPNLQSCALFVGLPE